MTTPGIDAGTVRLVAQRLNHYATPIFISRNRHAHSFYIVYDIQNTCKIKMRWAGYVTRMEKGDVPTGVSLGNLKE